MKPTILLTLVALIVPSGAGIAGPLNDKSKAPDWAAASAAEKDAWLAAFKFERDNVDQAKVAGCLDDYTVRPLFATNALSGVASLCETAIEKSD
jgi:hypothetical protein